MALGIALMGAAPEDIEARLGIYETVRRDRASAIQTLSNAGVDQTHLIADELAKYTDSVPSMNVPFPPLGRRGVYANTRPLENVAEIHDFLWTHDVVGESVRALKAQVPDFELPSNFFEADLCSLNCGGKGGKP